MYRKLRYSVWKRIQNIKVTVLLWGRTSGNYRVVILQQCTVSVCMCVCVSHFPLQTQHADTQIISESLWTALQKSPQSHYLGVVLKFIMQFISELTGKIFSACCKSLDGRDWWSLWEEAHFLFFSFIIINVSIVFLTLTGSKSLTH